MKEVIQGLVEWEPEASQDIFFEVPASLALDMEEASYLRVPRTTCLTLFPYLMKTEQL